MAFVLLGLAALRLGWLRRRPSSVIPGAVIHDPVDETAIDPATGAVTSRQSADIVLPATAIAGLWDPEHLERVARTYWSTLGRFTLGLMHVEYSEIERSVVLLLPQLRLLTFQAPEYEMDRNRGVVRWRIDRGLLVSNRGRQGDGYLEIDIRRFDDAGAGEVRLNVAVEVANYYPALTGLSRRIYVNTQSRIHVLACNFFLRRLVRRDLDASRVGHFAGPPSAEQAPNPPA
ncbi:MAG TPA: hypothetical protein VGO36_00575 [Solirubrobacterales bacterium]|jgi:hypothetical protein|nr:hypothetical protein [Solirubrobacterales bacterium]